MHSLIKYLFNLIARYQLRGAVEDILIDLHPLKTNKKKLYLPQKSKTGTYSFRASGKNAHYKLYSCFNKLWVNQVALTTKTLESNQINIPAIYATKGKYILSEWINGADIRNELKPVWTDLYEDLVKYQLSIHNAKVPQKSTITANYINEFLFPRFKKYASGYFDKYLVIKIENIIDKGFEKHKNKPLRISHPDFTHFNLVNSDQGIVIIDNETLHFSRLWEYDILNTANIVFEPLGLKQQYFDAYARYSDISGLTENKDFWRLVWLIRLAGGKLQVGDKKNGLKIIQEIKTLLFNGM